MLAGVLTLVMCVCLLTTAALAAGSVASVSELEAAAADGGSLTLKNGKIAGDNAVNTRAISAAGNLTLEDMKLWKSETGGTEYET